MIDLRNDLISQGRYTDIIDELLIKQEGVNEQLKADNQMLWVKRMNNIQNRAEEIANDEIIYQ